MLYKRGYERDRTERINTMRENVDNENIILVYSNRASDVCMCVCMYHMC